jgi:hypothetical protein
LSSKDGTGQYAMDGDAATHNRSVAGSRPAGPTRSRRVDSFTTAASLVILWRYLRGESWRCVGGPQRCSRPRAPERPAVRRPAPGGAAGGVGAADEPGPHRPPAHHPHRGRAGPQHRARPTAAAVFRPQLPAADHLATAGNGSGRQRDSRSRVRELVAHERATGTRLAAREVAAGAGISERRAYELLRAPSAAKTRSHDRCGSERRDTRCANAVANGSARGHTRAHHRC